MTHEDRQLLLIDICARLMYGVICQMEDELIINDSPFYDCTLSERHIELFRKHKGFYIKPYLRPLSSMTEEESAELSNIISEWFDKELFYLTEEPFLEYALSRINYSISPMLFDWLNKKMFDFRGLIHKGLAISTEEFNPYKD